MARAALEWTGSDLASAAKVGINTVSRFEQGGDARQSSVTAMQKAMEEVGIEFISAGQISSDGGEGVRKKGKKS